jgi:hypothetical protein
LGDTSRIPFSGVRIKEVEGVNEGQVSEGQERRSRKKVKELKSVKVK